MPSEKLSVVIITLNEAGRIGDCLQSVSFADEILVADTGSTDRTREIAAGFGARVIEIPFTGFGTTKQSALEHITSGWVLSLDADERVTPGLREEIVELLRSTPDHDGYTILRQAWFLGKRIRHGGWHQSRLLRLFLRSRGRFSPDKVHEQIMVDGKVGYLKAPLEHHTDLTFPHYLTKLDRYSTLAAGKIADRRSSSGKRSRGGKGIILAFVHAFAIFIRMYILKNGWLDGLYGALLAVSSAYSTFLRYIKAETILRGEDAPFSSTRLEETRESDK